MTSGSVFNGLLEGDACPGHLLSSAPGRHPADGDGDTAGGLEGRNGERFHGPAFGVTCVLPASLGYRKPNLSDLRCQTHGTRVPQVTRPKPSFPRVGGSGLRTSADQPPKPVWGGNGQRHGPQLQSPGGASSPGLGGNNHPNQWIRKEPLEEQGLKLEPKDPPSLPSTHTRPQQHSVGGRSRGSCTQLYCNYV